MSTDFVILVDRKDQEIGSMEKMEAHEKGLLHRAFSIFIFNKNKELMIHQRADKKYHSGGLWTNTCCSHPRPGEPTLEAAERRLQEEMGFTTNLQVVHSFIYEAKLDNELTEHEFDHIIIGSYEFSPIPNLNEVKDWKWVNLDFLSRDIIDNEQNYTFWFKIAFAKLVEQKLIE